MTELLPCPFCGKTDKLIMHHRKTRHYDEPLAAIKCNRCGIRGRYQMTEARAITAWNTRAERVCERIVHGLEREREVATVSWTCSECHAHIGRDYRYCPNCGAKVVEQ